VLEATALAYAGLAALAEGAEEQARTSAGRARTLSTVLEVPVASAVSSLTLGTLRRSPNDLGVARQILEPFGSWPWHARLLDRIDPSRPAATNPGSGPAGADRVAVPSSDPGHSGPAAATTGRTAGGGSHPDGPPPPMVLRGLGGFHLEVAGRAVDLSAAKPMERSLLQMLALRAGQGWHREELIEGLWPDADADAGVHRLQVAVSALRRIVGRGPEGEELIVRRSDSYLLHLPAGSRVDVVEFEQAVAEATAARNGGLDVLERQLLARAVSLYRGVLLPAVGPSDWVIGPRRRLVGEFGEVCIRLATLDLADNAPRRACRVARAGLDADRYRDELWKLLIGGAEQAGNHAEAEQARRDYEEVLHELGV
jgi:DNA-binding SARP family transcriptional activator